MWTSEHCSILGSKWEIAKEREEEESEREHISYTFSVCIDIIVSLLYIIIKIETNRISGIICSRVVNFKDGNVLGF